MNGKAYHLNLLKKSEVLSSSPVRLRVMLPAAALLACVGMLTWWGMLYGNILISSSQIATLQADIDARNAQHAKIIEKMNTAGELEAELEQLEYYRNARQTWGKALTLLTEAIPLKVQLTRLEIPEPPIENLDPPKGVRRPPLWGPTGNVERTSLVLTGRAPKETSIISMMESLAGENFTNVFRIVRDPRSPDQSPKVRYIRQESTDARESRRMLAFEIEYTAKERRFLK